MDEAPVHPPAALDYASPEKNRRPLQPYVLVFIALACGLVPMFVGITTTLLWVITFAPSLEIVGFFTLMGGVVLFLIGMAFLLIFVRQAIAGYPITRRIWVLATLTLIILIGNFPLSAACRWVSDCYDVCVTNATGTTIGSLIITDPSGRKIELGPIAPGTTKSRLFHPKGNGQIVFSAIWSGGQAGGDVAGYIDGGMPGEKKTVTITGNATSSVR